LSEDKQDSRRLDRRGFLGAAAGVAVAGAGSTAFGSFGQKAKRAADVCAEVPAEIPKARRGAIHYTTPSQAWSTTALFRDFITFAKGLNCNAWEFAGSYPTVNARGDNGSNGTVVPNVGLSGWIALGSYAKAYGFRVVGTHDGPAPTSAANLGSAILKMNAWNCNQLGAGSGYPSGAVNLPNAGTAITNPSAITAWQESAHTMNSWGQAYQTNSGAGVIGSTPYGPGIFAGTALTSGRTCARYYRHFHSEQGKWIQNTGTKYDLHYISEVIYTETDPNVAYAQSDQCWLLDGLWMSGGSAPSVGIQGAGEPHPGQGRNRLVQPDIMERWQDRVFAFHIKDLGSGNAINDQGTSVCNVGDNAGPGAATGNYPFDTKPPAYGAVPWATDGSQDTVQFQKIYERFRHPECHEYLFERDGMSNTVTSNAYWRKLYVQAFDMMDKLVLNRTPGIIRKPAYIPKPSDDVSVWNDAAHKWLPYVLTPPTDESNSNARPPVGKGAPGPECPPELNGENRVGYKLRVDFKGTWARHSNRADTFSYLWLRDGAPLPQYLGAPIGSKPECSCAGTGQIYYVIQPQDAGHKLSCQVTVVNDEDGHTSVVTESVQVLGKTGDAQVENDLAALKQQVIDMHLAAGPTSELTNTIDAIKRSVENGNSPCNDLDNLKNRIAYYVSRGKITTAQQSQLNSKIDAIKAEYPC
jgi:hypothetical protein